MKPGFFGQFRISVGCHSVCNGLGEGVLCRVNPNVNVGGVPTVSGIDVTWTSRGYTHQVGQGFEEYVVARPGPGFVQIKLVVFVQIGVVEKINCLPAPSSRNAIGGEGHVEVVRAVDMTGITHVFVIFRGACQIEGVVSTHGIAHHFHQRLHAGIEELGIQTRTGIRGPHQTPRRGGIQATFDTLIQPGHGEGLKIRTLSPLDIDDLDKLAGFDFVSASGAAIDAGFLFWISQGIRQRRWFLEVHCRAAQHNHQISRRIVFIHAHRSAGGRHNAYRVSLRDESTLFAWQRVAFKQSDRPGVPVIDPAGTKRCRHLACIFLIAG